MVVVRKDYAAPTGLKISLVRCATNMPRRWRWGLCRRLLTDVFWFTNDGAHGVTRPTNLIW